jgi:transcriptional regulator with XRE-family HTH domain
MTEMIGRLVKQRRLELDMTIRELGRRTGLSASFISQLEREKVNVSLLSLRLIAENLNVSIMYFFSEGQAESLPSDRPEHDPVKYDPVVRAESRPKMIFPDSGVSYQVLTRDLSRKMEAFSGRLAPGTENVARRLHIPTEEFIIVLSGALLVGLQRGEYILNPGDTIYFYGSDLVQLSCASEDEDAVWVSVITPPAF